MPYTTTHVLVGIILIELYRNFFVNSYKFPRYYILIMALASIFPDFEYIFQLPYLHRSFLHSLFLPLIFLLVGIFSLMFNIKHKELRKRHLKLPYIFFILSAGALIHILLDVFLRDGAILFYPFSEKVIGLNLISLISISEVINAVITKPLSLTSL